MEIQLISEIELTTKTEEEVEEIKEGCPNGHSEKRGDKVYWIFENKNEFGV